jgi:hypothetical protein
LYGAFVARGVIDIPKRRFPARAVTVIYTPFPLQDERHKPKKFRGQTRAWSIKMINTIADELAVLREGVLHGVGMS